MIVVIFDVGWQRRSRIEGDRTKSIAKVVKYDFFDKMRIEWVKFSDEKDIIIRKLKYN